HSLSNTTTTPSPPTYRYSCGSIGTSTTAQLFSWESPVPITPFRDTFSYCTARNFLDNFTPSELLTLPIDPHSPAPHTTKLTHLVTLLHQKLSSEKSPTTPPHSLFSTDYTKWYKLWQAIYTFQHELRLPEAEATVRMLIARPRPGATEWNVVPTHMLAEFLVEAGRFEEAEGVEGPVREWMDERRKLGRDSPQAISARRIIARAVWGRFGGRAGGGGKRRGRWWMRCWGLWRGWARGGLRFIGRRRGG
ncbi:hypothetical protein BO71DRAFT_184755, partial [Aspergillus ellipticus CBS 707.79]